MKKTVSLLLLFAVLLALFCACKKNGETQPTSSPEPTTWGLILDELPDIGKYKSADSPRMFDKYVDNLIPRSDYGELVPYLGAVADYFFNISDAAANDTTVKDGTFAETKGLFGLCRKDGTIVTDPVYASVQYCDGYYLLKKASVDTTYDPSDFRGNFYVVPKDGSSIFSFGKNVYVEYWGCGVFRAIYDCENNNEKYYSATGKLLLDNSDGNYFLTRFTNGVASLLFDGQTRFVDTSFKTLLTVPDAEMLSDNGYFAVLTDSGKYMIYKGTKPLSDRKFDKKPAYEKGYFLIRDGEYAVVLDEKLKEVSRFPVDPAEEEVYLYSANVLSVGGRLIDNSGKKLPYDKLSYIPELKMYVGGNYGGGEDGSVASCVVSKDFKTLYTAPKDWYITDFNIGRYVVLERSLDPANGEVYEYKLADTSDWSIVENVSPIDGFEGYSRPTEDGSHRSLFSGKDGKVLLTYSTFFAVSETSLGTLYFYDLDGYAYTTDADWNVLCRTTMNATD